MSDTMTQANYQWRTRPADERFTSLTALAAYKGFQRRNSKAAVIPNRNMTVMPSTDDPFNIAINLKGSQAEYVSEPTHWAFGQVCAKIGAPASYMRSGLPAALISDCLNWGLHRQRSVEELGILFHRRENGSMELQAATGPDYGRIWDADIADTLVRNFGNGIDGQWRVPGEFGQRVEVSKENTTLYASDSDMWVFLADEEHRIEIPNRRNGQPGSLARGFYIGNSQVGKSPLVFGMFLFDYVCCNRIIWGASDHKEIRIVHRAGAPLRWAEEVRPILDVYAHQPAMPVAETIKAAQQAKIQTDVAEFLASRFGKSSAPLIQAAHMAEEERPIETIWDAVTGATAYAKTLGNQDNRVAVERIAGNLLGKLGSARERVPVLMN